MRKFGLIVFLAIFAISGLSVQSQVTALNGRYCMIDAKKTPRSDKKMSGKEDKTVKKNTEKQQSEQPQPAPQQFKSGDGNKGASAKSKLDTKPSEQKPKKFKAWSILLLAAVLLVAIVAWRKKKSKRKMSTESEKSELHIPAYKADELGKTSVQPPMLDPVQEPIQETVQPPVQESVQMHVQETIQPPVQESVQKPVQETVQSPVQESVQMPVQETVQPPVHRPVQVPVQEVVQLPVQEQTKVERFSCPTHQEGAYLAADAGPWIVVGASVQGNGHQQMELPCQDSHGYEYLGDGWGIAIVSDGAGSAKYSDKGSAATVARAMQHFKDLIGLKGWKQNNCLPSDGEWMKLTYKTFKKVHDDVAALAHHNQCEPKDLNATLIVLIHSPHGLLVAHVGDGRAGYRDMDGMWHSLITPHKGEEANQTIFMESDFWNIPFFEMSGVLVPESIVMTTPISAFALMSDGCESTAWLCNQFNEETGRYYDPNLPFDRFFEPLRKTLCSFRDDNVSLEQRGSKWYVFIKEGNSAFVKETDDKTMIVGTVYQPGELEPAIDANEKTI